MEISMKTAVLSTLAAVVFFGFAVYASAAGCSPFFVASGGTGVCAIQSGAVPYGNGTGKISTTTAGTNGFVLGLVNGTPTWVATSTINNGVVAITVPQGNFSGTLTFATTSGMTIIGNSSTLTFNNTGVLSLGNGTGITCSGTNPGSCSISAPVSLANGGTGATSLTANTIPYVNNAGTALAGGAATSTIGVGAGMTNTGTLGSQVGGTAITLKQIENRSFSYATSSSWTGTTTIPLGVGYNEVWNTAKCYTDTGTLNVDFYHATTHFQFFNASTTIGTVNMAATTDTLGDILKVDIGTPASTPTKISCTINDTI